MLNKAINRYLALDPESNVRLQSLNGKVITIELLPFHFIFQLQITEHHVHLQANELLTAETKIQGTPLQLLGMMLNKKERQHFFANDITIEGNAELGQQIIALFDALEIDWEEHLSSLIGDVPAYQTNRFIKGIGDWVTKTKNTMVQDINEYLHEEAEWYPSKEALNDFFIDIDNLRMDADRLEARVENLIHLKQKARQEGGL